MSETTERVRAFYERYPYPDYTGLQVRADSFPHWLIAQVDREQWPRELTLLDAGCGTGAGLAAAAALHPAVKAVGVDLSGASIELARQRLAGLQNVGLMAGDLMDPAVAAALRTEAPAGFDVIYLSGVLHHVGEPGALLRQLAGLLAPDGVISLMVYAHYGRLPATRLHRALALASPEAAGRPALARAILDSLEPGPILRGPFDDARTVGEVELADRYLHPHAEPMRVSELFALLDGAELRLLRWLEPRAWSPRAVLGDGPAARAIEALDPRVQAQVLEELFDHPALECLLTHASRGDRPPPEEDPLERVIDRNPQVALRGVVRAVGPLRLDEGQQARLRGGPWEPIEGLDAALFGAIEGPIRFGELLAQGGFEPRAATEALERLLARELIYRPV